MFIDENLVSAVMVVRNGERFLQQAVESVLAQDYRPIEIILVDGQSSDRTAEIARAFPDIRYLYQENLGTANAYNMGIRASQGKYIAFLSYDDLWIPDKLRLQVGYLDAHPAVQYVIARVKYFLEPGCSYPAAMHIGLLEGDHVGWMMETLVARREVYDLVGMLDPSVSPADDTDWYARAKDLGVAMAVIERVLLWKRIHGDNTGLTSPQFRRNLFVSLKRSAARKKHMAGQSQIQSADQNDDIAI